MKNQHGRLTQYGVVALAGIAVLGWVREPEKHLSSNDTATAGSAEPRATFFPPPETAEVQDLGFLPGDSPAVPGETKPTSAVKERRANSPTEAGVVETPDRPPADSGRHEDSRHSAENNGTTRSREPGEEHPLEPVVKDDGVRHSERPPQDINAANTAGQTQQPVVVKKERSTVRSAAIIIGAAAAGAAIGGVTGGGKGAAIGAISGGAGGYVYDRMTRRKGVSAVPPTMTSDIDQQSDGPTYDRAPSLARRFGTPTFN